MNIDDAPAPENEMGSEADADVSADDAIAEKYVDEMLGERPFNIQFFPKIALVSTDTNTIVTRIVFKEVDSNEEIFSRKCSIAVLLRSIESIADNCLFSLKSLDDRKEKIISMPVDKSVLLAELNKSVEDIQKIIPLVERLQKSG